MNDNADCPKCGLKVAPNAPHGLCPGCLFKEALEMHWSTAMAGKPDEAPADVPPTPEELAPEFPQLEILRFVGRGGMGVVYQARQKQLDRMVALKILSPRIARDPAFAERFAREARMMALLTHPNVVAVYEFGTSPPSADRRRTEPLYYFLMEFVDGPTLRQLLDVGQLTPLQAFAIVPQICEALQFAHDKGVVHRDIKPENILLDRQGRVKIADFGLAKLLGLQSHDVTISTTGQVLGTLYYMAPEQMERPLEVDHRADIYSLGVVFYQMLTGELPLGRFAPPSQKVYLDARLDEVVMRALEKEPQRRYQQASALQSQVETIANSLQDAPPVQPGSSGRRRSWLPTLRWQSRATKAIVGVVLIFMLLGCVTYSRLIRHAGLSVTSLADSPSELARESTARVIQAGLEKPLSPWAWQELNHRTLTPEDVKTIMDGLTAWMQREPPQGMKAPMFWLHQFVSHLQRSKLVTNDREIAYFAALQGELRVSHIDRVRAGAEKMNLHVDWRWIWEREMFNLTLLNEMQNGTIDGELVACKDHSNSVEGDRFSGSVMLPSLKAGKHVLHLEVLSALVLKSDLEGIHQHLPREDWPPAKKLWTRSIDLEFEIYEADAAIVGTTVDPALCPNSDELSVESILVRRTSSETSAIVVFKVDQNKLRVPFSFDVVLKTGTMSTPCGELWASTPDPGGRSAASNRTLTAQFAEIKPDVTEADVILTPNIKLIEEKTAIEQIWGREIVFRKVPLRRLDLAGAEQE